MRLDGSRGENPPFITARMNLAISKEIVQFLDSNRSVVLSLSYLSLFSLSLTAYFRVLVVQLLREYRKEYGPDVFVHQDLTDLLMLPINGDQGFARIWEDKVFVNSS
jgi:hypothetical protein